MQLTSHATHVGPKHKPGPGSGKWTSIVFHLERDFWDEEHQIIVTPNYCDIIIRLNHVSQNCQDRWTKIKTYLAKAEIQLKYMFLAVEMKR